MSRNKRKKALQKPEHGQAYENKKDSDYIQGEQLHQDTIDQRSLQSAKEYEMLRTEILQYLEEYQSVRNMMYLATAAILGMNSLMFQNYYLFLLPLIVILPSYLIFYSYWKSVTCASTYIQVFLDMESVQTTYHWELRHRYFSELYDANKKRAADRLRYAGMHCHQWPYLFCSFFCLALYWINMLRSYISPYVHESLGKTLSVCVEAIRFHFFTTAGRHLVTTWCAFGDVLLGGILIALIIYIFMICWNVDDIRMTEIWEHVKALDTQREETLRKKLGFRTKENSDM